MGTEILLTDIGADEAELLGEFVEQNSHPNLRERPHQSLIRAVENMNFIAMRTSESLCGVAGYFDYLDFSGFELGLTRITLNGFRLQRFALAARLLILYTTNQKAVPVFTAVKVGNERAMNNIEAMGFVHETPSADILAQRANELAISATPNDIKFYAFNWRHIPSIARAYVQIINDGVTDRNGATKLPIRITHPWLRRPQTFADIQGLVQ